MMDEAQHISHRYDSELKAVQDRVLTMGELIERQIDIALAALVAGDHALAEQVTQMDHEVNAHEVAIDEQCTRILARHQPAARDLRLIIAIIKTITDLERIGDEAERIARQAVMMTEFGDMLESELTDLEALGQRVKKMLHIGLDAFARLDAEAALRMARKDKKVDREYEGLIRKSITYMMEDPRTIRRELAVLWCARALERIGDHAKNMAEYVVFLVHGKDVRHLGLKGMEREVHGAESVNLPNKKDSI
ncbi:MAG: phosphate signaling complex protein PhoU [Gammaproteobacteria bacterium]